MSEGSKTQHKKGNGPHQTVIFEINQLLQLIRFVCIILEKTLPQNRSFGAQPRPPTANTYSESSEPSASSVALPTLKQRILIMTPELCSQ